MKSTTLLLVSFVILTILSCEEKQNGKHVFILSGQSNMVRMNPEESFIPVLNDEYGAEHIIVVKDAMGAQPIRRWYKDWKPERGGMPQATPDLYDSLMTKVDRAVSAHTVSSVTFIWMQGERDAREGHGEVYEKSLKGLYQQLSNDLGRKDINFIIGRLNDFDLSNEKYPHWTLIRDIQVQVGESDPRFDWVNTDDLNDGYDINGNSIENDLHMSAEGYKTLGKRFAIKAIERIRAGK